MMTTTCLLPPLISNLALSTRSESPDWILCRVAWHVEITFTAHADAGFLRLLSILLPLTVLYPTDVGLRSTDSDLQNSAHASHHTVSHYPYLALCF